VLYPAIQSTVKESSDYTPMPNIPVECAAISKLFPKNISLACMRVKDASLDVFEAERPLIEKAVAKRRREFSAGRCCARQALRALDCADAPIIHDQNGAPLWPQGIVGSITHSKTHAAAVAAETSKLRGLGIDLETVSRVSPAITNKILTAPEKAYLLRHPDPVEKQHLQALFFSAKEAIYKCLHPLLQCRIGFQDARIECMPDQQSINIVMCTRIQCALPGIEYLHGRYCYFDDTVCTAVWLEAES
jgi:4'-phosphopantetheinyl transferase EntD